MDETLLRDLAQYKNYKDKAVTMAARGLIGVYRMKNPELLIKADRVRRKRKRRGEEGRREEKGIKKKGHHRGLIECIGCTTRN